MSNIPKFFKCEKCGKIVGEIITGSQKVLCCDENMHEIVANTVDAAKEKHVPVTTFNGDALTVEVGSVAHPMTAEHYIQWIFIHQDGHTQRVALAPDCAPTATFKINPGRPVEVYEYCNLHGLWKA